MHPKLTHRYCRNMARSLQMGWVTQRIERALQHECAKPLTSLLEIRILVVCIELSLTGVARKMGSYLKVVGKPAGVDQGCHRRRQPGTGKKSAVSHRSTALRAPVLVSRGW